MRYLTATKGHKVVGIDISGIAVEKANALAREFPNRDKGCCSVL